MSVRGNSGNFNIDKRFGTELVNTDGGIGREQHYLERLNDRGVTQPVSTDVTLWLKSDEGINLTSNRVSLWEDQSFNLNNIDMVQNTSSYRPNYSLNVPEFNNYPSVQFNGYSYNMESSNNSNLLDCANGFTVYVVARIINPASTYSFLITRTNGTSWTQGWGIMKYSNSWRFWVNNWNSTSSRVNLTFNNTSDVHIIKMRYDKVNIEGEVIGVINNSQTKAYTNTVSSPGNNEGVMLGWGGSSSYYLQCAIGEVLYYNRPINSDEQLSIEDYLKNKYNI